MRPIDEMEHTNGDPNGEITKVEENGRHFRRTAFRAMVQDFSPLWYGTNKLEEYDGVELM